MAVVKDMLPVLQLVATVISIIVVWGYTTGKFIQKNEDDDRTAQRTVASLDVVVRQKADQAQADRLEALLTDLHRVVIQLDVRAARIEERSAELSRRVEQLERRPPAGWPGGGGLG